MYLADDIFQATSGVGVNTRVIFCSALAQLYPVKACNATVKHVVEQPGHRNPAAPKPDRGAP